MEAVDKIVKVCVKKFQSLPKTGKPTNEEWTVVCAIVEDVASVVKLVSLGTGSKCLGVNSLSHIGNVINDSHAEVMARRGFLLYLLSQVEACLEGTSHLFEMDENGCLALKANVKFWFVCSAVPCGDAAIIPKDIPDEEGEVSASKKRRMNEETVEDVADIHRTGAKCLDVPQAVQDAKGVGTLYHVTGQVRTKPGRGDPTMSVSCSDKLARWNAVGVQGALLSLILQTPIFFTAVIIAGNSPYSEATLNRAINERIGASGKIKFYHSCISFGVEKSEKRSRPSPCSISYYLPADKVQIAVEGRRLGATKTKPERSALNISKAALYKTFCNVFAKYTNLTGKFNGLKCKDLTYREMKDLAKSYQTNWNHCKKNVFKMWPVKLDGLENFKLS